MASLGLLILQNWKFNKTGTSPHGISGFADSTKLEIQQTGTSPHGISGFADSTKLEIQQTGTSPHGISEVAVLVDQHIAKDCLIHIQFKDYRKE